MRCARQIAVCCTCTHTRTWRTLEHKNLTQTSWHIASQPASQWVHRWFNQFAMIPLPFVCTHKHDRFCDVAKWSMRMSHKFTSDVIVAVVQYILYSVRGIVVILHPANSAHLACTQYDAILHTISLVTKMMCCNALVLCFSLSFSFFLDSMPF